MFQCLLLEGEYAFKLRKPIVPLRVEVKYLPDGWLGALVGNSLFFDISTPDKLKINFDNFVRELGDRGKVSGNKSVVIVRSLNPISPFKSITIDYI